MTGTRMLQRRGTAAEWAEDNPILGDGEIGWERDTHIIKVGDGITAWNALQEEYLPFENSQFLVPGKLTVESALISMFRQPATSVGVQFEPNGNDTSLVVRTTADGTAKIILASNELYTGVPLFLWNNLEIHGAGSGIRVYGRDSDVIDFEMYVNSEAFQIWSSNQAQNVLTVDQYGNLVVPGTISDLHGLIFSKTGDTMTGALTLLGPEQGAVQLVFKGTPGNKSFFIRPGIAGGIEFVNNAYTAVIAGINDAGRIDTNGGLYDNGNRAYSLSNPDTTRVAKAGDTMTGDLLITKDDAGITLTDPTNGKILRFVASDLQQFIEADNEVRVTTIGAGAFQTFKAGSVYDTNNRVYSASNPPPGGSGGSSINQTQRGTVSIGSGNTSATVTITTVNMAKTQLRYLGSTSSTGDARIELTSATVITATRSTTTPTIAVGYDLTEWT